MKYGCIGEHLKHSFSKEIHSLLSDYEYELREIPANDFDTFAEERDFKAINVTIPYKEKIIPYLYKTDENAERIGAVNTVINKDGKLYGYNTDLYGMCELIRHAGISVGGKKVTILGTGGTSKTAYAAATALGAADVIKVSRSGANGAVTYGELYREHADTEIIINTTPAGMYPDNDTLALDIKSFRSLSGVIDAVYNPLRTRLISEAKDMGIPAEGGLYMLVAQAIKASELFTEKKYPDGMLDAIYKRILSKKESTVLVGMPASGKSTVGRIIADRLSLPFYDTDTLIEKKAGMSINKIFKTLGEERFRNIEAEVIKEISYVSGAVIASGGGAVLRSENISALKQNGRIYFIDRPPERLLPTDDRPLAKSADDIKKRYAERYKIYCECADKIIDADCSAEEVAEKIIKNKTDL